jgi:putative ABC transport system substrate-binding protein
MRRREFIAGIGGAAAWPTVARAQQGERVRRIAVLIGGAQNNPQTRARADAFRKGLEALGWIEGRNLRVDYRFPSDGEQYRVYTAELVGLRPEVILSLPPGLRLLQPLTRTIPIVFVLALDPIGEGFVTSLARPGGNMTGFAVYDPSIQAKWLQLLKEVAPNVARVLFLYSPLVPGIIGAADAFVSAAPVFSVEGRSAAVRNADDIKRAIEELGRVPNGGLFVPSNPIINDNVELIHSLAAQHRLPSEGVYRFFAASGGLMSYGVDDLDQFRLAASYVDRVLKGEKPSDLPVQYPTKYELVINAKTAKTLGLAIPETLLARADEVIE